MRRCPRKGCKADMSQKRPNAVWCSRSCYIAVKRDANAYRTPTTDRRSRSGRQISYRKAVNWLTSYLIDTEDIGDDEAHYNAEQLIGGLLPDRQRKAA